MTFVLPSDWLNLLLFMKTKKISKWTFSLSCWYPYIIYVTWPGSFNLICWICFSQIFVVNLFKMLQNIKSQLLFASYLLIQGTASSTPLNFLYFCVFLIISAEFANHVGHDARSQPVKKQEQLKTSHSILQTRTLIYLRWNIRTINLKNIFLVI